MIHRWLTAAAQYLRRPPTILPHEVCASIVEEIRFHVQEAAREDMAAGMPAGAAHRAAHARFGDMGRVAADCYAVVSTDQIVCHRLHLGLTVLLVVAVLGLWLFQWGTGGGSAWTGDLTGRVVNERGEPIGGAHVLAVVKIWPPNGYRQQAYMTTTGPSGRFRVADVYAVGQPYEVQIATVADRRTLQSTYLSGDGQEVAPLEFQLEPSRPLVLRIEGADGVRIAGAEVFPHRRIDRSGRDHLVYFQSAEPIIRRTNGSGVVELPCYLPGDRATLYVRLPEQEWQTREVLVPAGDEVVLLQMNASDDGEES